MARLKRTPTDPARRVAVIDDDATLLLSTLHLLQREGFDARGANDPAEGVELVRAWRPAVVLLDYFMPGATGADVVREVRAFDDIVQVLLVTGYAAERPARQMLAELDIQGYHDKTDGPHRLLVQLDAAVKHHGALLRVERQRRALRHILSVSDRINRLQPADELFRVALENAGPLLGAGDGFIATENSGFLVTDAAAEGVSVRAGTGRFRDAAALSAVPPEAASAARAGLTCEHPATLPSGFVVLPLPTRDGVRGCMVLEGATLAAESVEACEVYARQIMVALENIVLYERATVDALTRLYNRAFGLQRLDEALALDRRQARPTSVAVIDVDHFKSVNDNHGHAGGDITLRAVAAAIRHACRATDVAARLGGEEFLVVLPDTDAAGAADAAERIRAAVADCAVPFEREKICATVSVGVATSEREAPAADELLRRADAALYRAKGTGRNRVVAHPLPLPTALRAAS